MTILLFKRLPPRLAALTLAALSTLALGCASVLTQGDRAFKAGELERAENFYLKYLTGGRAFGDGESRARYRIGVIRALPDAARHDQEKANRAFDAVIAGDPDSIWGRQALLLRSFAQERDRLTAELTAAARRADALRAEVARLTAEAELADDQVDERDERIKRLTAEIGRLNQRATELAELLAARELELEQIKRIDLQTPP